MAVLNLRDVPEELMRELRAQAALRGAKFHPFCIDLLREKIHELTAKPKAEEQKPVWWPIHPAQERAFTSPDPDPTDPPKEDLELEIT